MVKLFVTMFAMLHVSRSRIGIVLSLVHIASLEIAFCTDKAVYIAFVLTEPHTSFTPTACLKLCNVLVLPLVSKWG